MSTTPYFRCSTVFSEFEALHLLTAVSLTEARNQSSLLGVVSPGPATLARPSKKRSHKHLGRRAAVKLTTKIVTTATATSSLLKLRRVIRSKNRCDTVSHNPNYSTTMFSSHVREKSRSTPSVQLRSPTMTLISLEEAAKRPDLTKELYLGDNTCVLSYTSAQLQQKSTKTKTNLISLDDAAARPELTKRMLFL